jgi:alpha-glucosidase
LPDVPSDPKLLEGKPMPFWDQDGVHEIYKEWRKILDSYPNDRMAVAEAWVSPASRIARYLRPGELMNSFNFDFMGSKWDKTNMKEMIDRSMSALSEVGAPSSWVFNNHDVTRSVDRFDLGLGIGGGTTQERHGDGSKLNIERGTKRARAGALLMLALPGVAYMFQGEELALPEVRDIPDDRITDPSWKQSGFKNKGRDGCRVPIPWQTSEAGSHGFSTNSKLGKSDSWLPQPKYWGDLSVEKQESDINSTLNMYRKALSVRKAEAGLGDGPMQWLDLGNNVLAFSRPGGFICILNFGNEIELPAHKDVLIASGALSANKLPTDTAVWLRA